MNDFKLIAVRPRTGCNKKFLKVLEEGSIYTFYNDYEIATKDNKPDSDIERINYLPTVPKDLYKLNGSDLSISICAIVGKNGSGKSSIIELFYVAIFNISILKGVLYDEISSKKEQLLENSLEKDIKVDIIYQVDTCYYILALDGNTIKLSRLNQDKFDIISEEDFDLRDFFYSIAINYSHYALNSREIGDWVNYVFVKNDAYQTPLVLNPFREKGDIDINKENYLIRSRLLSNVLSENENLKALAQDKEVKYLKFSIDDAKFEIKKRELELYNNNIDFVINLLLKEYVGEKKAYKLTAYLKEDTQKYIFRKLSNICLKYNHYHKYRRYFINPEQKSGLKRYFEALKKDNSHITFKLRQAIYYLLYGSCIAESQIGKMQPIKSLADKLKHIKTNNGLELIEIIPPSFFTIEIYFDEKENSFEKLSSGEKQKIYSIASLTYHLQNLDTVQEPEKELDPATYKKEDEIIKYKKVNIILDEIELYYHPNLQRTFIRDLLEKINAITFDHINGINLIFATHSPFILSDIPNQNILRLKEGHPQIYRKSDRTFGSNIHDLLANDFFMEDRFIGEWAYKTISILIDLINSKKRILKSEKADLFNKIELIGEPFIRTKLQEMVIQKLQGSDLEKMHQSIRLKEAELATMKKELKQRRK